MSTEVLGLAIDDPAEDAWRTADRKRRHQARNPADYRPPPLPRWTAPAFVTREQLGRFLIDADTGVVHDVSHATAGCGIDEIQNCTWTHFASEIVGSIASTPVRMHEGVVKGVSPRHEMPAAAACPLCLVPFARAGSGPIA